MEHIVGRQFYSYEEVTAFVKQFETENFIQLNRVLSKKLSANSVREKYKNKITAIKKDLVYYSITYMCVHGGKYKYAGACKRKTSSTKLGCTMKIRFNVSPNGQCLQIVEADLGHNHEISRDLFLSLPKQRRLQECEKRETLKLLKLKCDKKMLKNYLKSTTGKIVTLKDLSNLKAVKSINNNDFVDAVEFLKRDPDSIVEILTDEENNLEGIFFQDKYMQRSYENYPEVLLCDATYKLNNLRMPLYIFLIVNGNGHGEVVATFLLAHESENNIRHMTKIFKQYNERWLHTVSVITDKDFKERKVFKHEFPRAQLILCLFHTLKAFRMNITTEKMNINSTQRDTCLKILQKLAYSRNKSEYDENYTELLDLKYEKVTNYYNNNWHDIKEEWVEGLKKQYVTYNVTTTNHLESLNNKIKQVVDKMSDIKTFYEQLFIVFETVREELKMKAIQMATKKVVHHYEENSPESQYISLLTPYAFDFVVKQITYSKNITNIKPEYETTSTSCNCNFRINMRLPCSHIFYQKSLNNENLFDEALVDDKFKRKNYFHHQRELMEPTPNNTENYFSETSVPIQSIVDNTTKTILSTNEKYKRSMLVCQELASCISEYGTNHFKQQFEKLKQFTNLIKDRKDFLIVEMVDEANNESLPLLIGDENKEVNRDGEEVEVIAGGSVGEQASIIHIENTDQAQSMNKNNKEDEVIEGLNIDQTMNLPLPENAQEVQTMNENIRRKIIDEEKENNERLNVGDINQTCPLSQIHYRNRKIKQIGRPRGIRSTCAIGVKKRSKKKSAHPV